jgi:hypothetical protein
MKDRLFFEFTGFKSGYLGLYQKLMATFDNMKISQKVVPSMNFFNSFHMVLLSYLYDDIFFRFILPFDLAN